VHVHAMIELLGPEDIVYGLIWESFLAVKSIICGSAVKKGSRETLTIDLSLKDIISITRRAYNISIMRRGK
jgi:hypothetical protein